MANDGKNRQGPRLPVLSYVNIESVKIDSYCSVNWNQMDPYSTVSLMGVRGSTSGDTQENVP